MTDIKIEFKNKVLKTIEIQNGLVEGFNLFDLKTKEAVINHGNYWTERLYKESFTLTQLKSIANEIPR